MKEFLDFFLGNRIKNQFYSVWESLVNPPVLETGEQMFKSFHTDHWKVGRAAYCIGLENRRSLIDFREFKSHTFLQMLL